MQGGENKNTSVVKLLLDISELKGSVSKDILEMIDLRLGKGAEEDSPARLELWDINQPNLSQWHHNNEKS